MDKAKSPVRRVVVGGGDTHKNLAAAAIVDDANCVLKNRSFSTTEQGYRQMLWLMWSFGALQRIQVKSAESCGAEFFGLMQAAGIEVPKVMAPDLQDRRRGKNEDRDAQNAAHAAFVGLRM